MLEVYCNFLHILNRRKIMKSDIGITKELDTLGRLVIPKEMRALFHLDEEVELIVTADGILIRNPQYRLVKTAKSK